MDNTIVEQPKTMGNVSVYEFGTTNLEIHLRDEKQTLILRMANKNLVINDAQSIEEQDGSILINTADSSIITLSKTGSVSFEYKAVSQRQMREIKKYRKRESEFTQEYLETEDSPELPSMQLTGIVEASPVPLDPKNSHGTLIFIIKEENPENLWEENRYEVVAQNGSKRELKTLKIVRGTKVAIEAVKLTYEIELTGGEKKEHTRYNLVKVLAVEKKEKKKAVG